MLNFVSRLTLHARAEGRAKQLLDINYLGKGTPWRTVYSVVAHLGSSRSKPAARLAMYKPTHKLSLQFHYVFINHKWLLYEQSHFVS